MAVGLLEVKLDASKIAALASVFSALGKSFPTAIASAINHTGDKAKTQMQRAMVTQTGLRRAVIVKALKVTRASAGSSTYTIRSSGGDISLKYFGARETAAGVSAAPRGVRQTYAGAFMKGGRFPNRVTVAKFNGQVFKRAGSARNPIVKQKSGVFIPEEMVSGESAASFQAVVDRDLPDRLQHELLRALGAT